MELKDLIHRRILRGVSFNEPRIVDGEEASSCTFVLGRDTFTAVEDPSDGYRSSLGELIPGGKCSNMFPLNCHVRMTMVETENQNLLIMTDIFTNEPVLTIGTTNTDDYYPSFVSDFQPQNMAANKARR